MEQFNPYVLRTAMMLEELEYESQRAAYMVISDMHRLKAAVQAAERSHSEMKEERKPGTDKR